MKKTTSIKIDPQIWKLVKKRCIDEDIDIGGYLERLIKKDMEPRLKKII